MRILCARGVAFSCLFIYFLYILIGCVDLHEREARVVISLLYIN